MVKLGAPPSSGLILSDNAPTTQAHSDSAVAGSGTQPSRDDHGNGMPAAGGNIVLTAYKTADETVNNSVSLQDDNHLTITLAANTVYIFESRLIWTSGSTPLSSARPTTPTLRRRSMP